MPLMLLVVIIVIITFFIKAIKTFREIDENNDESLKEMNKKGSRYMIIAVVLIPVALFILFRILANMFLAM
ncbi:hypothetical protein [Clostridium sp.]|uniref:hypothetical protein n=1 Tax=Clostridium sp. TaxID=1506 RepID=UPI002FCBA2E0